MSDKPCFLNLIVRDVSNNQKAKAKAQNNNNNNNLRDISIGMQLQVGESLVGGPLLALIQTAASNLVHSLSNDIGSLLLDTTPYTGNGTIPLYCMEINVFKILYVCMYVCMYVRFCMYIG